MATKTKNAVNSTEAKTPSQAVRLRDREASALTVRGVKSTRWERLVGSVLVGSGLVGLFASFMLSIEEFHHLKHPGNPLNCDLNPLIGCGSILDTWQGHALLGVPNQFWGIAAFSVLVTLGVLVLSKVTLPRWIWRGLQLGMLGGIVFVLWFIYQSMFVLNHLCPYCMVTWAATLVVVWYVTLYNIQSGNVRLPRSLRRAGQFAVRHHLDIIITIFVVVVLSILYRFRDFFLG